MDGVERSFKNGRLVQGAALNHIVGLHLQPGETREENDYYATHPSTVKHLLDMLRLPDRCVIRENSCGEGHLSKALEAAGHTVISTDLIYRGYGIGGVDFLKSNWLDTIPCDAVVMNPPYKHLDAFILKSLKIAPLVAVFMPVNKFEGIDRYETVYKLGHLRTVGVFVRRQKCVKNAEFDNPDMNKNTKCYCWFIFDRNHQGLPTVQWLI